MIVIFFFLTVHRHTLWQSHPFLHLQQASVSSSGMFACSSQTTRQTPHYTVCVCVCVCVCVRAHHGVKVHHKPRERLLPKEEEICEVVWFDSHSAEGQRQTGWRHLSSETKKKLFLRAFAHLQYVTKNSLSDVTTQICNTQTACNPNIYTQIRCL